MKRYILTLGLFLLLPLIPHSCDDAYENSDMKTCDVENPLEDLAWLKDIKQTIQLRMSLAGAQIIQYTYKGEPVFWVDLCYQCPDGLIQVYNCSGEVLCEFGGIDGRNTCIDFETEARDSTNLLQSFQSQ